MRGNPRLLERGSSPDTLGWRDIFEIFVESSFLDNGKASKYYNIHVYWRNGLAFNSNDAIELK